MVRMAVALASVLPPAERVAVTCRPVAVHAENVRYVRLVLPTPLAGTTSRFATGSMAGQPGGIPVPAPTYRAAQVTSGEICVGVQFCATRVAVEDWPALMAGGLNVNELTCTMPVPVQVAAEADTVVSTSALAATARSVVTAAIRRMVTSQG
jgi:hypothetical protein